jgi:hypothetical protein
MTVGSSSVDVRLPVVCANALQGPRQPVKDRAEKGETTRSRRDD